MKKFLTRHVGGSGPLRCEEFETLDEANSKLIELNRVILTELQDVPDSHPSFWSWDGTTLTVNIDLKKQKIASEVERKCISLLKKSDELWIAAASRGESGLTRKGQIETYKDELRSLIQSEKQTLNSYATEAEIDAHVTVWPTLPDPT